MKRITVPFFISHQGCRHACVFCDQRIISGSPGALPSHEQIIAKISAWRGTGGDRPLEVAFFGGTFSALDRIEQQYLLDPLQPLLKRGEVTAVRISTRPDAIDAVNVAWLADHGVRTIELGVQSMDNAVLEAAGRGHCAELSEAAIHCIRSSGLIVGAQLMPGLPGDTPEISLYSLERVIAAGANFIRLYPVVVLRGTELARRYHAGTYRPLDVNEGVFYCKRMLLSAMKSGVDVIRTGLQADQGLTAENVLAGCWHPALGQLVHSELFFDLLAQLGSDLHVKQAVTVKCHPARISDVIGHARINIKRLYDRGLRVQRVLPDKLLSPFEVELWSQKCTKGSILYDLAY